MTMVGIDDLALRPMTEADITSVRALHNRSFAVLARAHHTQVQIAAHEAAIAAAAYADDLQPQQYHARAPWGRHRRDCRLARGQRRAGHGAHPQVFTFPNGCHIAEVEIDPETGVVTLERYIAVDDYGRLINPLLTTGQVQGGVAQGIGQALFEHTVYDSSSGQLLSGSLMDYALPRADDLPPFDITLAELPTSVNPLGVKGSGQAGCIAAPQTIINAIVDALSPLGIDHIDMPATPERIWRAIRAADRRAKVS